MTLMCRKKLEKTALLTTSTFFFKLILNGFESVYELSENINNLLEGVYYGEIEQHVNVNLTETPECVISEQWAFVFRTTG